VTADLHLETGFRRAKDSTVRSSTAIASVVRPAIKRARTKSSGRERVDPHYPLDPRYRRNRITYAGQVDAALHD